MWRWTGDGVAGGGGGWRSFHASMNFCSPSTHLIAPIPKPPHAHTHTAHTSYQLFWLFYLALCCGHNRLGPATVSLILRQFPWSWQFPRSCNNAGSLVTVPKDAVTIPIPLGQLPSLAATGALILWQFPGSRDSSPDPATIPSILRLDPVPMPLILRQFP